MVRMEMWHVFLRLKTIIKKHFPVSRTQLKVF